MSDHVCARCGVPVFRSVASGPGRYPKHCPTCEPAVHRGQQAAARRRSADRKLEAIRDEIRTEERLAARDDLADALDRAESLVQHLSAIVGRIERAVVPGAAHTAPRRAAETEERGVRKRPSVEDVAERWQRRTTGPWTTKDVGPATVRYRRRRQIEYVRLDVAYHRFGRGVAAMLAGWHRKLRRIIR